MVSGHRLMSRNEVLTHLHREVKNPHLREQIRQAILSGSAKDIETIWNSKGTPVGIEEFIFSKEYMNATVDGEGLVYPVVLDALKEINSGRYVEVVFTGGIGSGKTTAALYTVAYQLYLLSRMKNPHKPFGLDPATEIMFIFQNLTLDLARRVGFARFKEMIDKSTYFQRVFPYQKDLKTKMKFPNRIEVIPVSGSDSAAIGQNVIGGMIDELNYMDRVEQSKQSVDGGTYDQAIEVYNSIARRRKSRFMNQGKLPGILCLVSSRRYPGQFTDIKEEQARTDPTIYIYDKCMWDIKPGSYCGERFPVFVGDEGRKPRFLETEEADDYPGLVRWVPIEHRDDFEADINNALRELAGVSTLARNPFFALRERVVACIGKRRSVVSAENVDFQTRSPLIVKSHFTNPNIPRWVHVDLSLTGDSTGVAIGHCSGFREMPRGDKLVEVLPVIEFDMVLEVRPPKGGEIEYWRIRDLLFNLRAEGLNLQWLTTDSHQSNDFRQLMYQQGFSTGLESTDTSPVPYKVCRSAMYDGRVLLTDNPKIISEFSGLEQDPKTGKIDHNSHSCFTGDTRLRLADGSSISFQEASLASSTLTGVTWDRSLGTSRSAPLLRPHVARWVTELVEVELDTGEIISCTPEHLWLLRDGTYKQAQDLTPEDNLQD